MSTCPRCQAQFTCCMADKAGPGCWCDEIGLMTVAELPATSLGQTFEEAKCYCPACLQAWKAERAALQNKQQN